MKLCTYQINHLCISNSKLDFYWQMFLLRWAYVSVVIIKKIIYQANFVVIVFLFLNNCTWSFKRMKTRINESPKWSDDDELKQKSSNLQSAVCLFIVQCKRCLFIVQCKTNGKKRKIFKQSYMNLSNKNFKQSFAQSSQAKNSREVTIRCHRDIYIKYFQKRTVCTP